MNELLAKSWEQSKNIDPTDRKMFLMPTLNLQISLITGASSVNYTQEPFPLPLSLLLLGL
jgi:hypothetical protein